MGGHARVMRQSSRFQVRSLGLGDSRKLRSVGGSVLGVLFRSQVLDRVLRRMLNRVVVGVVVRADETTSEEGGEAVIELNHYAKFQETAGDGSADDE